MTHPDAMHESKMLSVSTVAATDLRNTQTDLHRVKLMYAEFNHTLWRSRLGVRFGIFHVDIFLCSRWTCTKHRIYVAYGLQLITCKGGEGVGGANVYCFGLRFLHFDGAAKVLRNTAILHRGDTSVDFSRVCWAGHFLHVGTMNNRISSTQNLVESI